MDLLLLKTLPENDPYRRVFDGSFEPQVVSQGDYDALRSALVNVLLADIEHRPCTASMRSARLGRFVPFLAWCLRQGYPMTAAKVLDPDLIETYIAQCPEAASTTDGVYQLRSALAPLCSHFGNSEPPAQKVQRTGTRSKPAVPMLAARRRLRVADSLRNPQARHDARVVLALAHGVGMETRNLVTVNGIDVACTSDGTGALVTHGGQQLPVAEPYADILLQVVKGTPGRLLGDRTRSVADTVDRLNEALATSGYSLKVDVAGLRAGWREWQVAVGMESAKSRDGEV